VSDFYQTGNITTLHQLSRDGLDRLESELGRYSRERPIGLVLPALYSEFERPAMAAIVDELSRVDYLQHIVVALGRASKAEYLRAREFMSGLPCRVTTLWIDSPRVQSLFRLLDDHGLTAGEDGKGRSCWLSYGYLLASGDCDVIALHDCDVVNYDRSFLARLCYPVVNPNLDFEFSKGYYARVTDRMHGRVTRLFMTPLIRALEGMAPASPLLRFLDSFRYCLAGEFAMKANLARVNRIPGDWGLEVGVLAEVHRNCSPHRICQVDLADCYEHKHQALSPGDPSRGLRRMTCDIAKTLFRTLAGEGVVLGDGHLRTLGVRYVRLAEDSITRYYADALLNDLEFDRHAEEQAVATFARSLTEASAEFLEDPLGLPLIPNWNRVVAAIPEFFELLTQSVTDDAEMVCVQAA
jgi:glucosyl-3-phosphoglycerate synthase